MKNAPNPAMRDAIQQAPFNLDAEAADWVWKTYASLTPRRKLAQLFNVFLAFHTPDELARVAQAQPGAVTQFLPAGLDMALQNARMMSEASSVPLLFSADVEAGSMFSVAGCTPLTNQLGMAAMNEPQLYERAVDVMAEEAAALGINWTFTPVLDINAEFRSAIVATRSFGSDPVTIQELAGRHVGAMQRHGVAATAKHWPGEGFDARDQHLLTTINPLGMAQWRAQFGQLFKAMFAQGVLSVMSAHIALPAYAHERGVEGLEAYRPASISRLLNVDLLRDELGFNGVVVSDATGMAGLSSWGPWSQVLPEIIENGCDMILFSQDIDGDLDILNDAIDAGRLSEVRVEQAVLRVLAMKAALGLHKRPAAPAASTLAGLQGKLATPEHLRVGELTAAAAPTLLKDTQGLLPLSLARHRRVLIATDTQRSGFGPLPPAPLILGQLLAERGFEVSSYPFGEPLPYGEVDLIIYLLAQESQLTRANIFLDWTHVHGPFDASMRRHWHDIPSLLISFGQPYYLYDAPRMPCVINAYSAVEPVQRAVLRKLLGEEAFTGVSPVDAFCGLPDAHY